MTPEALLRSCEKLMKSKRADYSDGSIHQNFDRSKSVIAWFSDDTDKVYVTLITTKLARLAVLLSNDREPNSESISDSFKDLVNYCTLWGSKRSSEGEQQ